MPRIPLRTEPYSSPARQQRHFKSKRDRTLKQLGSASHINGSQFALMLVSAKGEVEVYASELFKPSLPRWMNETIKSEARAILLEDKERRVSNPHLGGQQLVEVELPDDEDGNVYQVSSDFLALGGGDMSPLFEGPASLEPMHDDISPSSSPAKTRQSPPALTPVDVALANQLFNQASEECGLTPVTLAGGPLTPSTSDTLVSAPTSTLNPNGVTSALDEWFCNKFHLLQQNTCKLVAKCWIKVIEPKKQNKYPYQRAEESRPEWWPVGVRHKEPDHLIKPERNALLLAILNSGRVPVTRLELSTAEAMAHIQPDKFAILREVYTMAKEQELRRNNPDYRPRLPLTAVPVIPPVTSPVDDHLGHNITLGKRQRSSSENMTDMEPRRQSRRVTLGMQSIHDIPRSDSLPGSRQLSATIARGQIPAQHTISPSHSMHLPVPPHPFAFAPHRMPPMLHHLDAMAFDPQNLHHLGIPGPQHFPLPLPGTPFPFAPLGGEHLAFPFTHHLPPPGLNEDLAHLIARRSAQSAQGSQPLNAIHSQEASAIPPPPSPNSIAMMIWAGIPPESFPQNPLITEGTGIYHPMPSYPTAALAASLSVDSRQLGKPVNESTPVSPPADALSTSTTSVQLEESQQSSITAEVDTTWLK